MILGLMCVFVSFLTFSVCTVSLLIAFFVPGFFSNLCSLTVQFLEMSVIVGSFLAEVAMFLFDVTLEVIDGALYVYNQMQPHVVRVFHDIKYMLPVLWSDTVHFVNYVRVECWNFFRHQTQALLGIWALLLATVWTFTGRRRAYYNNVYRGNQPPGDNVPQRNEAFYRDEGPNNYHNRLYPNLEDIDVNYYDRNDDIPAQGNSASSTTYPRHRQVTPSAPPMDSNDESLCVVCLDKNRRVAVFPCGHTHTCLACTRDILRDNKRCPVCQTDIVEYRTVFL